jgi:hypothetical protein
VRFGEVGVPRMLVGDKTIRCERDGVGVAFGGNTGVRLGQDGRAVGVALSCLRKTMRSERDGLTPGLGAGRMIVRLGKCGVYFGTVVRGELCICSSPI